MALRSHIPTDYGTPLGWRGKLHEVIFGWETRGGRAFDVVLLIAISLSVAVVMLESVQSVRAEHAELLARLEWSLTILFTLEYFVRLISVTHPGRYASSFFGVVDVLAVLPTYAALFVPGAQYLTVIRVLRILRVFRVLKLAQYVAGADLILKALRASVYKISVFLSAVLVLVTILGSLMYVVEGGDHGFTSIPKSIYWSIVTLTTVGYGDISPQTTMGQFLASIAMLTGYAIIAVPTGIVTVELSRSGITQNAICGRCDASGHRAGAKHCFQCGASLDDGVPA